MEQNTSAIKTIVAAPDVLSEDPLHQTSLIARPSDTQINVNIPYADMTLPVQGPRDPFRTTDKLDNQNALAGHVEEQSMSEHAFKAQHLTQHILGYSANPSVDPTAPQFIGDMEAAMKYGGATVDILRAPKTIKKELKRKRADKGDLEIIDGDGAYVGPWGKWQGDDKEKDLVPEGYDEEIEESEPEREAVPKRNKKKGYTGQETSIFHGKQVSDYQGRTYMHPPFAEAPNLTVEPGSQETFIPKSCIHTWTGHTQGVSVIRLFPGTGHLLLSGSMDTKIKLWDVYTSGACLRTFMGHGKAVKDVSFSNDGRQFLSCGYDRQMKLWDTETGQCIKRFSNGKIPYVIRFNPDEDKQNIFLAGMSDKKIIQYDINSGEVVQEYDQHLGPVNTITFVDENRRFVTTSDDKTIRAWDYDIPVVIKYIAEPHMHSMPAVTLHPSNKYFAAQSLDNQILVYSTDNFRQNRKKRFAGHSVAGYACQVGFSPDGKWISSGDSTGNIIFWDWKTGRIKSRLKAHSKVVIAHEWLPHETLGWTNKTLGLTGPKTFAAIVEENCLIFGMFPSEAIVSCTRRAILVVLALPFSYMSSLITIVRNRFLDAIRSVNPPGRWKILVVDEHAQKLLGCTLKQFDILEENVTLIESINSYRSPQQFEAVYLLMPTTQNVDRIIADLSGAKKQYTAAHVNIIIAWTGIEQMLIRQRGLTEQLLNRLVSSPAEPHLKALKELYLNFWPLEARTFSLNAPAMFYSLFSPPRSPAALSSARIVAEEDLKFIAKGILNVCVALEEYPLIRYYLPSHHKPLGPFVPPPESQAPPTESSGRWRTALARGDAGRAEAEANSAYITKLLAFMVQQELDEYKKATPDFPKSDPGRPRGVLFITDRTMDTVAPLLHEFSYQAMCNDLLPIESGTKYRYKFQTALGEYEDKVAILSDNDNVWTEVRHLHMREAIDKLMADFNKFIEENAGFKGNGVTSLNDMKDLLANLPQYQEMREKDCATGITAEGKTPKHLVEEMVPLLDSHEISNFMKVRIIALYIQYREGVPDEDRRRLFQHARLSRADQDAINNLVHLGVRITRLPGDKDIKNRKSKHKANNSEYELSRYKPVLASMLEDHALNKLDPTMFPYVREPSSVTAAPGGGGVASLRSTTPVPTSSLRSAKPNWHRAPQRNQGVDIKQRLLVFVAGGVTYSEMREVYQASTTLGRDILIGSTHLVFPESFIDDMRVLEIGGVGSRALPNGLKPGERRSFQAYYDEKYYIKDPPPQVLTPAPSLSSKSSKIIRPSPSPSPATSSASLPKEEVKEKKKKGLFRF
ncbi:hypothetical protein Clacol_008197 [Clathrus columnatus]|uniref:Pre-mRNA-processing factor 17 n=1 Tax=Clathrus columnatus TaxID=1419009 RepID=A0AAV5AM51_9AGAM|nr:hypothetical protein Clacol_008197 [Clathrus columnatus]